MDAKRVWVKWMELRANNDLDAIETPTGYIPIYSDLKELFSNVLNKDYTEDEYEQQFSVKIPSNLEKIERIREIYTTKVSDTPSELFDALDEQEQRLKSARAVYGNYISPKQIMESKVS